MPSCRKTVDGELMPSSEEKESTVACATATDACAACGMLTVRPLTRPSVTPRPMSWKTFDGELIPSTLSTGPGTTDLTRPPIFPAIDEPMDEIPFHRPVMMSCPAVYSSLLRSPSELSIRRGSPPIQVLRSFALAMAADLARPKAADAHDASFPPRDARPLRIIPGRPETQPTRLRPVLTTAW